MQIELKELQTILEDHEKRVLTAVDEHVKKFGTEGDKNTEELSKLRAEHDEVVKTLNSVKEQIKVADWKRIPGLEGQEAKKFDYGMAVGAIMRAQLKARGGFNGDPWIDPVTGKTILEKEMLDEMAKKRTTSMTAEDGTLGGYLITEEVAREIVDLAIADMPIMELGPMVIRGLVGDLPINKKTARATGYWVGEQEAPASSALTIGQVTLRPKKAAAFTIQSNRLIYQSRGVSDQLVRTDLAEAMALTMETGYIRGLGTEKQPKGILNWSGDFTSSTVSFTAGSRFTIDNASAMIKDLDIANEYKGGRGNFGWLMRPEVKSGMKRERAEMYSGQAAAKGMPILGYAPLISDKVLEDLLGHKIRTTTLIQATDSGAGRSTSSKVLFGNFGLLRIGFWRDFILKASDVASDNAGNSAFLTDSTFVVCFQETDIAVPRGTAFTMVSGAETAEANW